MWPCTLMPSWCRSTLNNTIRAWSTVMIAHPEPSRFLGASFWSVAVVWSEPLLLISGSRVRVSGGPLRKPLETGAFVLFLLLPVGNRVPHVSSRRQFRPWLPKQKEKRSHFVDGTKWIGLTTHDVENGPRCSGPVIPEPHPAPLSGQAPRLPTPRFSLICPFVGADDGLLGGVSSHVARGDEGSP